MKKTPVKASAAKATSLHQRKAAPAAVPSAPVAMGARLRHARFVTGLLIKDLEQRVGVSISMISKHENDKKLPPLTVLHGLVTELGTNIGALFEPNWTGMGPMRHEGDEVGHLLEGRRELSIDDKPHKLGLGDSFEFPSNLAHAYRNPGLDVTRVLWINTPPTF